MKTVEMKDAVPLTKGQTETFIKVTMIGENSDALKDTLDNMEKEQYFPYMIYKKRMDVMKLPLKMTPGAVFFMLLLGDRPGHITCCMVDCMEYQDQNNKESVTMEDMATHMYPFGFYKEEAFIRRVEEIQQRKNKWDFIY